MNRTEVESVTALRTMLSDDASTEPEFSVIIPTCGRPELLDEAIASVQAQTVESVEIIVVDDGSTPAVKPAEGICLIRHEIPLGPAAARNAGVHAAHGRALAFLDDDDMWLPCRLELARRALERAPIGLCWSRYLDEPPTVQSGGRALEGDVSGTIREGMTPHLGQTALRRDAWIDLNESLQASEDVDWWLRVTRIRRVATESEVGLLFRRHTGARPDWIGPRQRVDAALRILEMHERYFSANRRACGFHWLRIGLTAGRIPDHRLARRALWRSFRLRPRSRTVYHLGRAVASEVRATRRVPSRVRP